jgi:hypothetical protein
VKALLALAAIVLGFPASAFAQDMPVPKMLRGIEGQKGEYQVEFLEGGPRGLKVPTMTVCTDNLLKNSTGARKPRAESGCQHRLLNDTADEAVVESTCPERKSTVSLKREGRSTLMTVESTGPRGPQSMKVRYTHLGACGEGQGVVSLDKDSEQCKKLKARAAKMDPAKQCARVQQDRETCEQRVREAAAQLSAMCS